MQITVELPEDIARHPDPGREALEALAVEGYRSRKLTQFDVGQLLGLSRIQTEDFLARHVDLYDYSPQELEAEADLLKRLHR
jgi:predicted HTH domain antitoxin